MKQRRLESHRALELLSDLYSKMFSEQDKQLKIELERIIRVLKSNFFQALIDIQEYYQLVLCESSSIEHNQSDVFCLGNEVKIENEIVDNKKLEHKRNNLSDEIIQVSLNRNKYGLGFSIAGGKDNPLVATDKGIFITKIVPGGPAFESGKFQINDTISKVNGEFLTNSTHSEAVEILKNAADPVTIELLRPKHSKIEVIELSKTEKGFGFSVAGGIGNQHKPGDIGIYVTKIVDSGAAYEDGRLKVGDKLIAVKYSAGIRSLKNVTHEEAVKILKDADPIAILFIEKSVCN